MNKKQLFFEAIINKKVVKVLIDSQEKGIIERQCIPFDYGPSNRYKDGADRYHFFTLNSPDSNHNLSILPAQLLSIEVTNKGFHPGDYVNWEPRWHIKREWGQYS